MRIITGALAFFESSAGIAIDTAPRALAAETAAGVLADQHDVRRRRCRPSARCRRPCAATLCVEPCRYSLPFCQYAIALRVSIG